MGEDPTKINAFLDIIFAYGPFWVYLAIFFACFIENVFPPFPGDSFIVAAGALSAVARVNFWVAFILILAGGLASVMLLYSVGRKYGRDFFLKKDYKYFSAKDIIAVEEKFNRWGAYILIVSRFVVGFRSALALVAGMSRFRPDKMLAFSAISYVLFSGLLMYVAFKLVENLELVTRYFKTYNMIVWPALLTILTILIIHRFRSLRKDKI